MTLIRSGEVVSSVPAINNGGNEGAVLRYRISRAGGVPVSNPSAGGIGDWGTRVWTLEIKM